LPSSGDAAVGEFKIKNPGQIPIEVVAIDFDEQHAVEEKLLGLWDGYEDTYGYSLELPRSPGSQFWEHIRTRAEELTAALSREEGHANEAVVSEDGHQDDKGATRLLEPDDAASSAEGQQSKETAAVNEKNAKPATLESRPFIAIVSCFEVEVEDKQAALLAARYQVPCTTLTDLVLDAGDLEHADPEAPDGPCFGDMIYERLIGWNHEADGTEPMHLPRPYEKLPAEQLQELLFKAIKAALGQQKLQNGFVLKGCKCEFAEPVAAVKALVQALGLSKAQSDMSPEGEEPQASHWDGPNTLWFADLQLSIQAAQERRLEMLSEEDHVAADGRIAEADAQRAAAAAAATTPPNGKKPSGRKNLPTPAQMPTFPPGIDPEFGAEYEKYSQWRHTVQAHLQSPDDDMCMKWHKVQLSAKRQDQEDVHQLVAGTRFERDVFHHVMPAVSRDNDRIAPAFFLQVLRKPPARKPNLTAAHFVLMGANTVERSSTVQIDEVPQSDQKSRWVLQPGEVQTVRVEFRSDDVLDVTSKLILQASGGEDKADITVRASCAYPQVCMDPKAVFSKSKKIKAGQDELQFKHFYIPNRLRYQFGAVLSGVQIPAGLSDAHSDHTAILSIQNSGRFDARVSFLVKSVKAALDAAEDANATKGGKGKKGPAAPVIESCFSVVPPVLEIPQGETGYAKLLCFPADLGEVHDAIVCTVDQNPDVVEYAVMATGEQPRVSVKIDGEEQAPSSPAPSTPASGKGREATPPGGKGKSASAKGPPLTPDTQERSMAFQRLLPGRKGLKSFTVFNKSKLSLHWQCPDAASLPGEFKVYDKDDKGKLQLLPNVGGLLAPGESRSVHIEFTACSLAEEGGVYSKPISHKLPVMIQDEKRLTSQLLAQTIALTAETYRLDAAVAYPEVEQLNFGTVKVQQPLHEHTSLKFTSLRKDEQYEKYEICR
jgi:hypothetical protein